MDANFNSMMLFCIILAAVLVVATFQITVSTVSTATSKTPTFFPANKVTGKDRSSSNATSAFRATICAVAKNEELYIDEWLQYHKFLGFDHVHIHDNADNASSYMASLPEKYSNFVSVTHSPGLGLQAVSYGKCVKEGANSSTWVAFIDVDEFIVLRNHTNIKAYLHDVAPNGGLVQLGWSIMASNGTMEYDPAPVVTRFTLTSRAPSMYVKALAYLPHVRLVHVHYCLMKPGHPIVDQHGRIVKDMPSIHHNNDREIATLFHYQTKSWEEFNAKRHRGFAFNYKSNYLYDSANVNATAAMTKNYNTINNILHPVVNTAAKDFYLKHCLQSAECHI